MANILKRPMFRRGGSASYDVGITSGLRRGYERGGDGEQLEDASLDMGEDVSFKKTSEPTMQSYADAVQKRLMPTDRESISDYLTALSASGASDDPAALQTFGSLFSRAAANYQNINAPKVQAAKKAGADVYTSLLKGSLTKEKLYLYQQKAKDLYNTEQVKAQQEGRVPKYKTPQDALSVVINQELYGKDTSQERLEKDADTKINKFNLTKGAALAEATIERRLEQDLEFQKKYAIRYKGSINESLFQKDTTTGNYILKNLQSKPNIRVNDVFVEPYTKKLYYFDGKKLVPEIN